MSHTHTIALRNADAFAYALGDSTATTSDGRTYAVTHAHGDAESHTHYVTITIDAVDPNVDAYAADRVVLAYLKLRAPDPKAFTFVTGDFSFEPFGLPMRRDDPDFRVAVNRALANIYRTGDIDAIFQRWLGALGIPGPLLHAMFYLNALPE